MARILTVIFFSLWQISAHAETRIEMEGTAIIGNNELPQILYIVPWKKSTIPQMQQPPINQIINEALTPLERDEFKRQIYYYQAFSEPPPQ